MWDGSSLTKGKPNPLAFARTVVTTKTAAQRSSRVPDASAPATTRPATMPSRLNTEAKAYIASMKSDLRNLVTAEEAYFADSVKYTATTACTTPPTAGAVNFCVTTGNNLGVVGLAAGNGGWGVTITNNNLTTPLVKCAIFINTAVLAPAVSEGAPACQ